MYPPPEEGKNDRVSVGFPTEIWVDSHPLAGRRVVSAGILIFTHAPARDIRSCLLGNAYCLSWT